MIDLVNALQLEIITGDEEAFQNNLYSSILPFVSANDYFIHKIIEFFSSFCNHLQKRKKYKSQSILTGFCTFI